MTNADLQKRTKDRPTWTIINTGGEVRFSGRVNSFYSRCGTCRVIPVTYLVMFSRLCVRVVILFAWGIRLHDRIISLRGEFWTLKTSLTPSLFIEVPESSQERELSFICVLRVSVFFFVYDLLIIIWNCSRYLFFSFFILSHQLLFVESLSITMSTHQEKPVEKPVERPLQHGLPSEPFLGKTGGRCISYFNVL